MGGGAVEPAPLTPLEEIIHKVNEKFGSNVSEKDIKVEQRFMANVLRMSKAFNLCNSSKDFNKYEFLILL